MEEFEELVATKFPLLAGIWTIMLGNQQTARGGGVPQRQGARNLEEFRGSFERALRLQNQKDMGLQQDYSFFALNQVGADYSLAALLNRVAGAVLRLSLCMQGANRRLLELMQRLGDGVSPTTLANYKHELIYKHNSTVWGRVADANEAVIWFDNLVRQKGVRIATQDGAYVLGDYATSASKIGFMSPDELSECPSCKLPSALPLIAQHPASSVGCCGVQLA